MQMTSPSKILSLFVVLAAVLTEIEGVEEKSFRSILIERACSKRPELEFCGGNAPEVKASSAVPLVLPPLTPSTTSTTTSAPTTTTTSNATSSDSEVDFEENEAELAAKGANSTEHEKLGSLVKLPKPEKTSTEKVVDHVIEVSGGPSSSGDPSTPSNSSTVPKVEIEDEKGVLVFVSEYCVVERERFVRSCHGEVEKKEETFCKTYVSACASTTGVLPVMTYCARYYTYYPTYCKSQLVDTKALQFCFAFENFCLPEKTAAIQSSAPQKPKSSLRKCEDVLPEARKVCNPFPNPKDTFNLLRCTHFLTNCKKYVDWLK